MMAVLLTYNPQFLFAQFFDPNQMASYNSGENTRGSTIEQAVQERNPERPTMTESTTSDPGSGYHAGYNFQIDNFKGSAAEKQFGTEDKLMEHVVNTLFDPASGKNSDSIKVDCSGRSIRVEGTLGALKGDLQGKFENAQQSRFEKSPRDMQGSQAISQAWGKNATATLYLSATANFKISLFDKWTGAHIGSVAEPSDSFKSELAQRGVTPVGGGVNPSAQDDIQTGAYQGFKFQIQNFTGSAAAGKFGSPEALMKHVVSNFFNEKTSGASASAPINVICGDHGISVSGALGAFKSDLQEKVKSDVVSRDNAPESKSILKEHGDSSTATLYLQARSDFKISILDRVLGSHIGGLSAPREDSPEVMVAQSPSAGQSANPYAGIATRNMFGLKPEAEKASNPPEIKNVTQRTEGAKKSSNLVQGTANGSSPKSDIAKQVFIPTWVKPDGQLQNPDSPTPKGGKTVYYAARDHKTGQTVAVPYFKANGTGMHVSMNLEKNRPDLMKKEAWTNLTPEQKKDFVASLKNQPLSNQPWAQSQLFKIEHEGGKGVSMMVVSEPNRDKSAVNLSALGIPVAALDPKTKEAVVNTLDEMIQTKTQKGESTTELSNFRDLITYSGKGVEQLQLSFDMNGKEDAKGNVAMDFAKVDDLKIKVGAPVQPATPPANITAPATLVKVASPVTPPSQTPANAVVMFSNFAKELIHPAVLNQQGQLDVSGARAGGIIVTPGNNSHQFNITIPVNLLSPQAFTTLTNQLQKTPTPTLVQSVANQTLLSNIRKSGDGDASNRLVISFDVDIHTYTDMAAQMQFDNIRNVSFGTPNLAGLR